MPLLGTLLDTAQEKKISELKDRIIETSTIEMQKEQNNV